MRPERRLPILALLLLAACQTPAPLPEPAPPPPLPVCPAPPPAPEAGDLQALLAYAQDLHKALAFSQGRGGAELAQATAQLELAASATEPQIEPLKPLATLLAARLAEQRRLQDNVDKLTQQLRDSQRRNEQLNEKLEALKAIEQTLPVKR
ncbi:hypothetical protein [Roseateles sp.]|uniref:hypothetical protein n=1 Tax=Roseateles sp. TaxID=1971397 RepID=UPI0025CC09A8|nr:hypothetical protein [Roseateles sp.]MBV8037716.1 hypothetical protein [Roseateles sp.]